MKGEEIKINYAVVEEGRKIKCEITTGLFSRWEHHFFRSVSKTVSIPEDLGHQCDWRTYHSRRGILDASRKFRRKILGCAELLIECHSIL
jgi:hypothetical protein